MRQSDHSLGIGTLAILLGSIACGGSTDAGGRSTGGAATDGSAGQAGAPGRGGSDSGGSPARGGTVGQGGAPSAGGSDSGGSPARGGTAGQGGDPTSSGGLDCSMVGCGEPPLCSIGCTEPCGCCPCAEGETQGQLVCRNGCWDDSGQGEGCTYGGVSYQVGETFAAEDGCNTCSCSEGGQVACTLMACVCDPESEVLSREYVTTDPAECAVIDYSCPENTTHFTNDCGCGCQQSPDCPEWFNCMPSTDLPPCDEAEIRATCPYSGIAY